MEGNYVCQEFFRACPCILQQEISPLCELTGLPEVDMVVSVGGVVLCKNRYKRRKFRIPILGINTGDWVLAAINYADWKKHYRR